MNLEGYRILFIAGTLVLMLIIAFPTLSLGVMFPSGAAKFSEFWLLGPNHMLGDYPFTVKTNETYQTFVGVGNHMGQDSYYKILVKFRSSNQPLPNDSEPSPLPPLYECQFFVANEGTWESNLNFSVSGVSFTGSESLVRDVTINEAAFPVNSSSPWSPDQGGSFYQMFVELWLYNMTSKSFQYHNRYVEIWLNLAGTS